MVANVECMHHEGHSILRRKDDRMPHKSKESGFVTSLPHFCASYPQLRINVSRYPSLNFVQASNEHAVHETAVCMQSDAIRSGIHVIHEMISCF